MEHLTGPLSPLSADDVPAIVAEGELVRRGAGRAGRLGARSSGRCPAPVTSSRSTTTRSAGSPRCWEAVGRATRGARRPDGAARGLPVRAAPRPRARRLLDRTDPALVGLALDTGELTVGGHRPARASSSGTATASRTCSSRTPSPSTTPRSTCSRTRTGRSACGAARARSRAGSPSPVPTAGSSTSRRSPARCCDAGYAGWIVVESDQSPHPAASALLAGYLVQRELRPILEKESA